MPYWAREYQRFNIWLTSELTATYHLKGIGAITRVDSVPVTLEVAPGRHPALEAVFCLIGQSRASS